MKRPREIKFGQAADVPNSKLPVLVCRGVLPVNSASKARRFREAFRKNGWVGIWTDTIYDYMHFHSNAHEVRGVAKGKVTLLLGGEKGKRVRLRAGDMLVLPAGTGHRRIGDDTGLEVVGAYPRGHAHFDIKRTGRRVPHLPLPTTDPFYGEHGPLLKLWSDVTARSLGR